MRLERSSGIILHPTALSGPQGVGTLGKQALAFVDWLHEAGQRYWQMCPLGPTGFGNSPYQCFSAFAGNPLLIDLQPLVQAGLLQADEAVLEAASPTRVDFSRVLTFAESRLQRAFQRLVDGKASDIRQKTATFSAANASWLDDYALFMALKGQFQQRAWNTWDEPLRLRDAGALAKAKQSLASEIEFQRFVQYVFSVQWRELRQYAHSRDVRIIGDLPIYVAYDSADVWAHRELFQLDAAGLPRFVAGVPPDFFSKTGQLWGNPLYNWEHHRKTGFRWWTEVVREKFATCDVLRIDHFRGFAAYWAIPFGDRTAERGQWCPAPGAELFAALRNALGDLPILAEDLGVITPDVVALREKFGFPGMLVLQFAFDAIDENEYRPFSYARHAFAYTGTHDNDTTQGWYDTAKPQERTYAQEYLGLSQPPKAWDFVRLAWASTASVAMAPLQDVLGLGSEARFNTPGTASGNWEWRVGQTALTDKLAAQLKRLSDVYARADDVFRRPRPTSLPAGY